MRFESFSHLLSHFAQTTPDAPALRYGEKTLTYEQLHDMVLDGFEREVREMKKGEKKTFTIKDYEAFGEYLEDNVDEIPMEAMPNIKGIEIGKIIWMIGEDENKFPVTVKDITRDAVTLDYNHPLAGKDLTFDVEILEIDESTADDPEVEKQKIPNTPLDLIM